MKKGLKKTFALLLSLCMMLGSAQIPGLSVHAAEDGTIDTTEEGWETVRYYTNTDTAITSVQTKSERVADFFQGTGSMEWSVEFKTTSSSLQALAVLEYSTTKYMAFFVRDGNKIGFETKDGTNAGTPTASKNYNDGNWHTAKLKLTWDRGVTLSLDDETVIQTTTAPVCIEDLSWTPDTFSLGGMTNYSGKNGWTFNGTMRNVVLKKKVSPVPILNAKLPQSGLNGVGTTLDLSSGSVNFTYRLKTASKSKVNLLEMGNSLEIYTEGNKVGIQSGDEKQEIAVTNTKLDTEKWHNLTVAWDEGQFTVYVDAVKAGSASLSGTVSAASIKYGENAYFTELKLYNEAMADEYIAKLHANTSSETYPDGTEKMDGYVKTPNRELFNSGFDGSVAYRIPALVTSKKTGTVFAAIDKRWDGSGDVGVIDNVIRRSEDNGQTWGPVIPVIDLADNYGYTMDAEMVVDNNENSPHYGRVYMLVDMFRDGVSLWGAQPGTGYTEINGKYYQILTDSDGNTYTVRENGIVYDSNNEVTAYQVETESAAPYRDQGTLYRDGMKIGNIYKNSELTMYNTCYLWMTYSDDDGLTWELPKDLTPYVKADWMTFFGLGPGAGAQLQSGRLIFTTYCMDSNNRNNRFSSYNVYTDDHGKTWHRGASPNDISETQNSTNSTRELNESCIVELNNGHLIQFMKNATSEVAMAVSTTQGESWEEVTYAPGIKEPYCEMSALHYPKKILDPRDGQEKEAIIFSNPTGGRDHGMVRIAFVNEDDTLDWAYSKLIEDMRYLYSSLTYMNNGLIGLIYEHESYAMVGAAFTSFSPEYIMDGNTFENTPVPTGLTTTILNAADMETDRLTAGGRIKVKVAFSQKVFAAGNVTLEMQVGNELKEASLVGNDGANALEFVYDIQDSDTGIIKATGNVRVKEGGAAETIYNVSLTNKPHVTQETVVGEIGNEIFTELPVDGMSATAGSAQSGAGAELVLDGDTTTLWHSKYPDDNGVREKHYVTIDLGGSYLVSGLKYTPRSDAGNGNVKKYQIEVSKNGTDFVPVTVGTCAKSADVKTIKLDGAALATHVRFRILDSGDNFGSAAEIRIIGTEDTNASSDKTDILNVIAGLESNGGGRTGITGNAAALLANLKETAGNHSASEEDILAFMDEMSNMARQNLAAAIKKSEEKIKENYNITSWSAYAEALDNAKAISETSAPKDIILAYTYLQDAENNLAFTVEGINSIFEEMKPGTPEEKEKYTAESWNAYETAYTKLQDALKKGESTVALRKYMKELEAAKDALKEKTDEPEPKPVTPPDTGKKPTPQPSQPSQPPKPSVPSLVKGKVYQTSDGLKYKVTDVDKKTVSLVGVDTKKKKKLTSLNVKNSITLEKVSCQITEIGAKAFSGCKKLKKVTIGKNVTSIGKQAFSGCGKLKTVVIKGKMLKKVGAKAFKGIYKKATIKVPKAQKKKYKKLLAKKGQAKTVKIK
ncbi:discoidin domain-containing protein [Lachnospiraceae bacterium 46-15]